MKLMREVKRNVAPREGRAETVEIATADHKALANGKRVSLGIATQAAFNILGLSYPTNQGGIRQWLKAS